MRYIRGYIGAAVTALPLLLLLLLVAGQAYGSSSVTAAEDVVASAPAPTKKRKEALLLRRRLSWYEEETTAITDSTSLQTAVTAWCSDATSAEATYGHISNWDTSGVTDMSHLFSRYDSDWNDGGAYCSTYETFDEDLSKWDVSRVENMEGMFAFASVFNNE